MTGRTQRLDGQAETLASVGAGVVTHAAERQVRREGAALGGEAQRRDGRLDGCLKLCEPLDVSLYPDPQHTWLARVGEAAGVAELQRQRASGGNDASQRCADSVELVRRRIAQKLERQVDAGGRNPFDGACVCRGSRLAAAVAASPSAARTGSGMSMAMNVRNVSMLPRSRVDSFSPSASG